jgi:hypothetical protein
MNIFIKISNLGEGLGPEFILSDDFGLTIPYKFTRQQLLDGVEIYVNNNATKINVKSTGICTNVVSANIPNFEVPLTIYAEVDSISVNSYEIQ